MITQLSFKAPHVELKNLRNLWFHLTGLSCNLKCKHCYLGCFPNNKTRNFLTMDKIKVALEESKKYKIEEIYLTGGEPLLHPDINNIIRLTLKHTNVTILTNATLINDKKARFLRHIEQDFNNELIFRVSLDHYSEEKCDEIRGKGSFKKILSGIDNLIRYGFNPIISAVNIWEESEDSLKEGFFDLLKKKGFEPDEINLKIILPLKIGEYSKNIQSYEENEYVSDSNIKNPDRLDCANTRVVTDNGIYACPALVNDPRGKVGSSLLNSSEKFFLEPNACYTCQFNKTGLFNNNWSNGE
ncbi:MAG: radical SAM protein [Candidatus Gastranaerophilales bacterium]|nr:radical SAM protein [Candidatus Gastranaerophilales bacterium]